jgi:hypothetical protein
MSPRTSSPINLVSSSPLGPFPSHTKRHPDSSLSPTPTTIIAAKTSKAARSLSPGPAQTQDPSTPRPTPSPIPTRLASGSPLTKSRDFQTELIHALDRIYDGGRNRAAVREHETFDLLSHLHVSFILALWKTRLYCRCLRIRWQSCSLGNGTLVSGGKFYSLLLPSYVNH